MSKSNIKNTRPQTEDGTGIGNSPSLHKGHRARLRARFRIGGAAVMAEHELLELLLTYARPRVDVNPPAHRLIERFGSLQGVLTASEDELTGVPGIGKETAGLIRLVLAMQEAAHPQTRTGSLYLNSLSCITAYLHDLFDGVAVEQLYVLILDNHARLVNCCLLHEGTVGSAHCSLRRLTEACLYCHAGSAVLAHNHPGGSCRPSREDVEMTMLARTALEAVDVPLVEHIIVGEDGDSALLRDMREGCITL